MSTQQQTPPTAAPVTLTTEQVCEILHCSPGTLARWRRRGLIRPSRVCGGRNLYRREEVERVLRRGAR